MMLTALHVRFVLSVAFVLAAVLCVQEGQADESLPIDQSKSSPSGQPAKSFQQLQAEVARLKEEAPSRARLIEEWLSAHDLTALDIEQVAWCLTQSLPNDAGREALSVTFTGVLTPPRSGAYVFSTTPINVNRDGPRPVKHRFVATLGENTVLDALPNSAAPAKSKKDARSAGPTRSPELLEEAEWIWRGQAVELQADHQVPLKVVVEYESSSPTEIDSPSAILFWEGPGFDRQIIGASSIRDLVAEYRWTSNEKTQTDRQAAATIDFAWTSAAHAAPPRPGLVNKLTDRLWQLATVPAYLDACAAGKAIHVYVQEPPTTEYLDAARRQEFLGLLVERPQLLVTADAEGAWRLYRRLRFGAEEAAIDMLGNWMQLHADIASEIAFDFFQQNRRTYWELGNCTARQMPEHLGQLRDNYLRMDDGRCSLPLAYTLTYGYLVVDQLASLEFDRGSSTRPQSAYDKWIELLSEQLQEDSLSGDMRINWLLARAQAAEISRQPIESSLHVREELFAGKGWLDEANLVVESDQTKHRLLQETVARLAAYQMWQDAEQAMESQLSPTEAAAWMDKLKQLKSKAEAQIAADKRRTDAAVLAEFERRRQLAAGRGDDSAVERYSTKLEKLQATAETPSK